VLITPRVREEFLEDRGRARQHRHPMRLDLLEHPVGAERQLRHDRGAA
jgi:hypothetical protein